MTSKQLDWTVDPLQLQRRLVTELSDRMMRRRGMACDLPNSRLSREQIVIVYPWRLYDMIVELAKAGMGVLSAAGDNLFETLEQVRAISTSDQIPLRSPLWLHLRLALAAMIELEAAQRRDQCSDPIILSVRGMMATCHIEIGYALIQLAEASDMRRDGRHAAELFQSIGDRYTEIGRNERS